MGRDNFIFSKISKLIIGSKICISPSCMVALVALIPLCVGGLGAVLRPKDLLWAVTLLKKLQSWREKGEIESWSWAVQRASWQEQCPRGANANPVTWDGRNLSEWSSGLKIAGKHPSQVRKGLGRLPSWVVFFQVYFQWFTCLFWISP